MGLWKKANDVLVGGVNSPVRAFGSVGGTPLFIEKGSGANIIDSDGKEYIDYVCSWGAMIAGHGNKMVGSKVNAQLEKGIGFGAPHSSEIELAQKIIGTSSNRIRFCCSGTEALMTAIRLARGVTNKKKILKFNGCYHGHADSFLVNSGSGLLTTGTSSSKGIIEDTIANTLSIEYNSVNELEAAFNMHGENIAAVVLEVIAGNMNMVLPQTSFLDAIKRHCTNHQALIVADEVMTGFRVGKKSACGALDLDADLVCYGKVIGGGMPVGALVGDQQLMNHLSPVGGVYQAGTLAGNPLAMIAGSTVLDMLNQEAFDRLNTFSNSLGKIFKDAFTKAGIPYSFTSKGGMFGLCLREGKPNNLGEVKSADNALFCKLYHGLIAHGVYMAPSCFEAGFVSLCHGTKELEKTEYAVKQAISSL